MFLCFLSSPDVGLKEGIVDFWGDHLGTPVNCWECSCRLHRSVVHDRKDAHTFCHETVCQWHMIIVHCGEQVAL